MSTPVKAVAKAVAMSPRKVGEVAALVRGRSVEDALVILSHTPRRAAIPVAKTIASAAANAENNHNKDPKTLVLHSIEIGQGFALKRFRPAAHGRALPYKKMTSHITVFVDGSDKVKKAKKTNSETKATPAKAAAKSADKAESEEK